MSFRPYQNLALELIIDHLRNGKNPLLHLMVGGGKTHIFCEILKRMHAKKLKALMIVKGRKLVSQASERLNREKTPHGVAMAGHFRYRLSEPIQISSVDTLRARNLRPEADLIVLDEADEAISKSYSDILKDYSCPRLSVTATPWSPLGKIADVVVKPATFKELVEQGYLVAPRTFAPTMPNLKGIKKQNGEYAKPELDKRMDQSELIGDLVFNYRKYASNRKFLGFAVSIKHSKHCAQFFNENGIKCRHIDSDSTDDERLEAERELETGKIQGIWNVGIYCRGVDLPFLECMISARPTRSLSLWIQMMGRFTRPYPGKKDWICLDHSSNVLRHGFIDDEHEANLTTQDVAVKIISPTRCLICFGCFYGSACNNCGNVNESKLRTLEVKDGDLHEIVKLTPEQELIRYVNDLKKIRKQKKYKRGWLYYELKRTHGEEIANRFYKPVPSWVREKLTTQS